MFRRILLILIAASILLVLIIYSQLRPQVDFVSGVVQAHDIRLGSRVGGRVHEVLVAEGETVHIVTDSDNKIRSMPKRYRDMLEED